MAIEYIEVRRKFDREIVGIIDGFSSVIWRAEYYGAGDFEIYISANRKNIDLLKEGNYISRPNNIEIGIIESVQIETTADGTMIIAGGRFAKSILDRRHIYNLDGKTNKATLLTGNVESAARALVANNLISCAFDSSRNIEFLELGAHSGTTEIITDETGQPTQKQVSYQNLLDYSDSFLKEYKLGARVIIDDSTNNLQYVVYKGANRSMDNMSGNEPIIFSKEYDNLLESKYSYNDTKKKTAALIGGEGEGVERFYSMIAGNETGLERREMWVDASSISQKYKVQGDTEEHLYTDSEYQKMLNAHGKQKLASATVQELFNGSINVNGGTWRINEDYFLGDVVTFQDNQLQKYLNVRITELIEVQDENGYTITPVFDF